MSFRRIVSAGGEHSSQTDGIEKAKGASSVGWPMRTLRRTSSRAGVSTVANGAVESETLGGAPVAKRTAPPI